MTVDPFVAQALAWGGIVALLLIVAVAGYTLLWLLLDKLAE